MSTSTKQPPAFSTKARGKRIDLGLAVSGLTLKRGERRTFGEIAAYCDCTKQGIQHIERVALRKVRTRMHELLGDDFQEHFNDFLKTLER